MKIGRAPRLTSPVILPLFSALPAALFLAGAPKIGEKGRFGELARPPPRSSGRTRSARVGSCLMGDGKPCLPAQLWSKAICLCFVRGTAAPCGRVLTVDQGRELARTEVRRTAEVRVMKRSGARGDELGKPLSGLRPECAPVGRPHAPVFEMLAKRSWTDIPARRAVVDGGP